MNRGGQTLEAILYSANLFIANVVSGISLSEVILMQDVIGFKIHILKFCKYPRFVTGVYTVVTSLQKLLSVGLMQTYVEGQLYLIN